LVLANKHREYISVGYGNEDVWVNLGGGGWPVDGWVAHLVGGALAKSVVLVFIASAVGDAIADALNRNAIAIVAREFDVFEA